MKHILLIFLIIVPIKLLLGQSDSSFIKDLTKPIVNCEIIASNSQELITKYSVNDNDSIKNILKIWESKCGTVEPVLRMKILLSIKNKRFYDSLSIEYINKYYIEKFNDRIDEKIKMIANDIFEQNKAYFDYVPLKGRFDSLTRSTAIDLLPEQENGTTQYFFCLLFSNYNTRFENELYSTKYYPNFITKQIKEREKTDPNYVKANISVNSGIWQPVGSLSNLFNTGGFIGIQGGFYISKQLHLDFFASIRGFGFQDKFGINRNDSIYNVLAKYGQNFGISICWVNSYRENIFFDSFTGIGMENLHTDKRKISSKEDDYETLETIDVHVGINIRYRFFKETTLGLNIKYHYVPYEHSKLLKRSIGNQYLTIGLIWNNN